MSDVKAGIIFQILPRVMQDVGAVTKARKNPQQGYQFRGIDEIYNAVQPALMKHGMFIVPEVLEHSREERQTKSGGTLLYTILKVKHRFYASDGSCVECVTVGEAMDSGDKSANKAMSAAMKYALIETLCIPTEEPIDTENETHEVAPSQAAKATPQQVKEMKSLVGGLSDELIGKWWARAGVNCWEDMPADAISKCIAWVKENQKPAEVAAA